MLKITKQPYVFIIGIVLSSILSMGAFAGVLYAASDVQTSGAGLASKVAPGELLPISVKLLNFGSGERVDVTISYKITDLDGKEIYSASETIAVQTTATFVKTIQIPFETAPGRYIAKSSIIYEDQVAPASTEFPFIIERKIFGLFQSDFYLYGTIVLVISVLAGVVGHFWRKKQRFARLNQQEYKEIPSKDRIYYEILSDTIMQMRTRVGDNALLIAASIDGLKIDEETGRVLALTEHPSKIIATLVSEYENLLGKKVSFAFREEKANL